MGVVGIVLGQELENFFFKGQDNILSFVGQSLQLLNSGIVAWISYRQYINRQAGCVPVKLSYKHRWRIVSKSTNHKRKKLNITQINYFFASKDTKKMKRQPIRGENIFANHRSGNRLLSRIYQEFLQLSNKKTPNWKMSKGSE